MAFNPFSWFRDNQKGVMIGLIGLCMVIFIFQFGPGDAFTRWLNVGGRNSGEVVATLYGKKVHESEISRIGTSRRVASTFLYDTVDKGQKEVAKALTDRMQELSKQSGDLKEAPTFAGMQGILQAYDGTWRSWRLLGQLPDSPQMAQFRQQEQDKIDRYLRNLGPTLRSLQDSAAKKGLETDDRFVFQQIATLLGFQLRALTRSTANPFYFGGGTRTEDFLDFRLWQLQADRLGIKLTDADVVKEIIAESAGSTKVLDASKSFADQDLVRDYLKSMGRDKANAITPSDLMDALREEFRVVMAQGVLLGVEPGARAYRAELLTSATPSFATPDEFLDFYREQNTALRIKLFPINAESFLSQIKGEPTEAELLARYDRGAKVEAMPFGREPGFKQPRRIKVEYVIASPEDAHYKKLAREQIATLQKLSDPTGRLSSAVISFLAPGVTRMVALAIDPLGKDYEDLLKEDFSWNGNNTERLDEMTKRAEKRHYTSVIQPVSIASLVAGFQGGLVNALASLDATSAKWEMAQMVPFNVHLLLSQSDPQNLLGAAAAAVQSMPPATPRSLLEPQILVAKQKSLAEDALRSNFETMATELRKLSKKPAEAKAYIAKAIKEYQLSPHEMTAARSPQDLIEELKDKKKQNILNLDLLRKGVLTDLARGQWTPSENTPLQSRQFIGYIFQGNGTYQAMPGGRINDTKQELLFWRTEDNRAEDRSFAQVRSEVLEAWRLDKARALARNQAEKLETKVNESKGTPADAERFLKEQKLVPFELEKVTQLVRPTREVHHGMPTQYRPYEIPEDKAEFLPYPPQDFAKQLMKLTRPGDATVIVDNPAKTYYIALLVDRTEPTLAEFKSVYVNSPGFDQSYLVLMNQRREEYRRSVMEQLRRDAGADLDKEGRFKLPESVRKADPSQFEGE